MESLGLEVPLASDVCDFASFLHHLHKAIVDHACAEGAITLPLPADICNSLCYAKEIESLYVISNNLYEKKDQCLQKMEGSSIVKGGAGESEIQYFGWSQYLTILKELHSISKIYFGAEERMLTMLRFRNLSLCALIVRHGNRSDDNGWLLEYKKLLNFEARRHLAMMMLPEVKEEYEEVHEMLIDRSRLLAESFEYIAHAYPDALHSGLLMEFKNEEATGPGVLREWFLLVCQAIFNPENDLFVACPNDRRRFFPNPPSKVDPLHLEYFSFAGRVIALALMHKVQVGVVFVRVFFMQLGGHLITLDDIKDADPSLYSSCKKNMEMDAEFLDSDALGLTFVTEVEELGARRVIELCPEGKSTVVDRKNRKEYLDLLIWQRFVTSISEQVYHFGQGFTDILCKPCIHTSFFESLELEDLDRILHGSENDC